MDTKPVRRVTRNGNAVDIQIKERLAPTPILQMEFAAGAARGMGMLCLGSIDGSLHGT